MPNETAEFAHVLFLDIAGYSTKPQETQDSLIRALNAAVRTLDTFTHSAQSQDAVAIPTGDGMALVFFRSPLAPAECAAALCHALKPNPQVQIRMGIHSGPVTRNTDIRGQANVTGSGINTAQRVMDSGEPGQILLSAEYANILRQYEKYQDALLDWGEHTVKHGVKLHIFGLSLDNAANPNAPAWSAAVAPKPKIIPSEPDKTVVLLYKRHAPHTMHLIELLEPALRNAGYSVFLDRRLPIGIEWAQELKKQVAEAYAVIPLLSAESIWSEMIEEEIQTAHEASRRRGGYPRILPVRVNYEGALPAPLEHALGHLQYMLWRTEADDTSLINALVDALKRSDAPPINLEPVGGAVPLDSRFYIVRDTDTQFETALQRRDSIVLVKGARQMGKTSLLTRGLQLARQQSALCLRTDFQKLTSSDFAAEQTFFQTLAEMIADQADADVMPDEKWNANRSGGYNFERYLRREILGKTEKPVVWALDEVDKLFAYDYRMDVFGMFRSWHNDRAYEPDGHWSKLTMVIAYATEAHLFITDVNQSPFNVGTKLGLSDFNMDNLAELNQRYGSVLRSDYEIAQLYALTGGQPYLTRRAFDHLVQTHESLDQVEATADSDDGIFGDHLRRLLVTLTHDMETLEVVRKFLKGEPLPSETVFYKLRSGGLLAGHSVHDAKLRCRLYQTYLVHHLF